ncbi:hypothetical protein Droror1_Dr00017660 [Drosera rotundifolia]
MISDPDLIRYACIAHKSSTTTTILFEFNSDDSSLQTLAYQCLDQTPPHHSIFSHTALNRAFTFLIEDPFVFFAIFDENLDYPDRVWLLNRLKKALRDQIGKGKWGDGVDFSSYCLQGDLGHVFDRLVSKSLELDESNKENSGLDDGSRENSSSSDSVKDGNGMAMMSAPLLGNAGDGLKKKRLFGDLGCGDVSVVENKDDLCNGGGGAEIASKELVACQKAVGLCLGDGGRQRARRIWRMRLWVVLMVDLAVCMILFGVWLCICQGFRCLDG